MVTLRRKKKSLCRCGNPVDIAIGCCEKCWFDPSRFDGYKWANDGIGCRRCYTYYLGCKVCDPR